MTTASRQAQTLWSGDFTHGSGTVSSTSAALRELRVTFKTRIGRPDGQTSRTNTSLYSEGMATCAL